MATVIKDIVTWLKQWFYTESEVDTITGGLQTQINNKADSTTVSTLSTTVNGKADKSGGVAQITDSNSANYTNIGSLSANSTQQQINNAINTKIGNLIPVDWIVVVSTLPTASASTMGRLYLMAKSGATGDNVFIEYITVEQSGAYSWEKLGELSGSGLSVDWSDITNKPSTFTPSSHTHDDRYYTETETNSLLSNKADASDLGAVAFSNDYDDLDNIPSSFTPSAHNHDDRYYTETEVDTALSSKADKTSALGTTITLVNKGETNEGCIIFNTIS